MRSTSSVMLTVANIGSRVMQPMKVSGFGCLNGAIVVNHTIRLRVGK